MDCSGSTLNCLDCGMGEFKNTACLSHLPFCVGKGLDLNIGLSGAGRFPKKFNIKLFVFKQDISDNSKKF